MGLEQGKPLLGPDGEFEEGFLQHVVANEEARVVSQQLILNRKEYQERMLFVMKKLEKENVRGLPPLYVTVGKGNNRAVVCTMPVIEQNQGQLSHTVSATHTYLIFSRFGFSVYQLESDVRLEVMQRYASEFTDPLAKKLEDHGGGTFGLVRFHNLLRSGNFKKAIDVSVEEDNKQEQIRLNYRGKPDDIYARTELISPEQAQKLYEEIEISLRSSYQKTLELQQQGLDFVDQVVGDSNDKQKRKKIPWKKFFEIFGFVC